MAGYARNLHWHALRTLLSAGAMFGFFYGLSQMPLINALTLGFTAPLMVTALSAVALEEDVGWRRWVAVAVGFSGVVVMLRPGTGTLDLASAGVLFAAFCYACLAVSSRMLGRDESSLSLSLYVITGPAVISGFLLADSGWTAPDTAGESADAIRRGAISSWIRSARGSGWPQPRHPPTRHRLGVIVGTIVTRSTPSSIRFVRPTRRCAREVEITTIRRSPLRAATRAGRTS